MLLHRLVRGPTSAEWIEHNVVGFRGNQYRPFRNHEFQFVYAWPDFVFSMTIRRCVFPEIGKVHSFGIHFVAVATVVLGFLAAMPAGRYWKPHPVEYPRFPLGVVQESVVGGVQLVSPWIRSFHRERDPMAKDQLLLHDRGEADRQFRGRIKEKRPARHDHSAAFKNPGPAPIQVLGLAHLVVVSVLVVLADIERGVREHCVDGSRPQFSERLKAVSFIQHTSRRREKGFLHAAST